MVQKFAIAAAAVIMMGLTISLAVVAYNEHAHPYVSTTYYPSDQQDQQTDVTRVVGPDDWAGLATPRP